LQVVDIIKELVNPEKIILFGMTEKRKNDLIQLLAEASFNLNTNKPVLI